MSTAGFFDVVGLLGTVLGVVSFTNDQIAKENNEGAIVRVKAGLHKLGDDGASLGGSINGAYAWRQGNGFNGQSGGCQLDAGGFCDLTIDQTTPGIRAEQAGISNNDDATCIAWITVQQYDGSDGGAWTGDIGWACGQNWYESKEGAGKFKDGGEYYPKCTWLDKDKSNDIQSASLKFNILTYGLNVSDVAGKDLCASTLWGADSGPIAKQTAKRSMTERATWISEQLIVSNRPSQTAAGLCNSATSWGPDFIGGDGQFCDMATKTLTPLCSSQAIDGCVEIDEHGANVVKRMSVARRATNLVHKSYKHIDKWES